MFRNATIRSSALLAGLTLVQLAGTPRALAQGALLGVVTNTANGMTWTLDDLATPPLPDAVFAFGVGGSLTPITGNWDGLSIGPAPADPTPGLYDPATGTFFLRNSNSPGAADIVFGFGAGGAGIIPLAGDWNNDGVDTIGLYNTATGAFFLRNSNSAGPADIVFTFGAGGQGFVPLKGDWDGDGVDTIGLYNPATGVFFLRNTNSQGPADLVFTFGPGGAVPISGDWNNDNTDTVGIYVASTGTFFLRNSNSSGPADIVVRFPVTGGRPVAGSSRSRRACDSVDFDCDGDLGTDADIEAFFACLAGACPQSPCRNDADFNNDGDLGTDLDIEGFFSALAGAPCGS
jgi:hypothetical protein